MKVFVYFNLHKRLFSIKALEGADKGKVVAHRQSLTLKDVQFKVSEAGRQRVIREKKKNVHAGVVGQWDDELCSDTIFNTGTPVTYNPYKYTGFVIKDNESPIQKASRAFLTNKKIYI